MWIIWMTSTMLCRMRLHILWIRTHQLLETSTYLLKESREKIPTKTSLYSFECLALESTHKCPNLPMAFEFSWKTPLHNGNNIKSTIKNLYSFWHSFTLDSLNTEMFLYKFVQFILIQITCEKIRYFVSTYYR